MKTLEITIEIPLGSNIKYEYDRKKETIVVDRILRSGFTYPANYGFIPQTLDWDGDELDVLVYSSEQFQPGVRLNARIIGAMKMIDEGETDTKIIAVHHDDYRLNKIKKLADLPAQFLTDVTAFFTTYKNWKRQGITTISGFEDVQWAEREYQECLTLMSKFGLMTKKDFIIEMKRIHPEKYPV